MDAEKLSTRVGQLHAGARLLSMRSKTASCENDPYPTSPFSGSVHPAGDLNSDCHLQLTEVETP